MRTFSLIAGLGTLVLLIGGNAVANCPPCKTPCSAWSLWTGECRADNSYTETKISDVCQASTVGSTDECAQEWRTDGREVYYTNGTYQADAGDRNCNGNKTEQACLGGAWSHDVKSTIGYNRMTSAGTPCP